MVRLNKACADKRDDEKRCARASLSNVEMTSSIDMPHLLIVNLLLSFSLHPLIRITSPRLLSSRHEAIITQTNEMANSGNANLHLYDNDILQNISDCERRVKALRENLARSPLLDFQRTQ